MTDVVASLIDTAPEVTSNCAEAKDATPLFEVEASSPDTTNPAPLTPAESMITLIPSPPVILKAESRRLTFPDLSSPFKLSCVATSTVAAAVNRPCASTVKVGMAVVDP